MERLDEVAAPLSREQYLDLLKDLVGELGMRISAVEEEMGAE
jgi:hypothetical protein